jgi:CRISPR-associated endonuclease/helicase Cas3
MKFPSFSDWFEGLWGYRPFRWQIRMAAEMEAGSWPAWVTLPTGLGKTSIIDIAVYLLAKQAHLPAIERDAPVRIVFAVNRRIVVDEAFRRAQRIATRLLAAQEDSSCPLHPVAAALRQLSGGDSPPLETYPLRGATYTDNAWARSVVQPLVITTTLDQLGSRLLFRGYGCSDGARPLHAALLANDALLILDEAHTSAAFSETLAAIAEWRNEAREPIALPFRTVQLTATPPASAENRFALLADERTDPAVAPRLAASKPTRLLEIPGAKKKDRHKKIAEKAGEVVGEFVSAGDHVRRVLIVVNRVETAKTVFASLKIPGVATALLVGGMRPLDRDDLLNQLIERFQLQSTAGYSGEERLVLVATQCVEVGADLDFDALVTELAPLDALRQRFGRLNRYGRDVISPAVVLAPEESLAPPDPVYGSCLPPVWEWLNSKTDGLDFGITALDAILPSSDGITALLAPQSLPPVLLAAHLDLLCQTSPAPHVEPEPALYIHGPAKEFPMVGVVVRDDLKSSENVEDLLAALPPLATEAATASLARAQTWLAGEKVPDEADAPAGRLPKGPRSVPPQQDVWIQRSGQIFMLPLTGDLRPGDILVLPTDTGNLADLIPGANKAEDQCEAAHLLGRDKLLIVLSQPRLDRWQNDELAEALAPIREEEQRMRDEGAIRPFPLALWKEAVPRLLTICQSHLDPRIAPFLSKEAGWSVDAHPAGGVILRGRTRVGSTPWPLIPDEIGEQGNRGDGASLAGHQADVEKRVAAACDKLGLAKEIARVLELAGRYHDIGKGDHRFQAWLHGCGVWEAVGKKVVAKSNYPRSRSEGFRMAAEVPPGFRHELLSAAILGSAATLDDVPERELLLHLVASHHGFCRATAPVVRDDEPEAFDAEVEGQAIRYAGRSAPLAHLQDGVPERFWSLNRRFGRWGVAYLETILRIADQRASATGSNR